MFFIYFLFNIVFFHLCIYIFIFLFSFLSLFFICDILRELVGRNGCLSQRIVCAGPSTSPARTQRLTNGERVASGHIYDNKNKTITKSKPTNKNKNKKKNDIKQQKQKHTHTMKRKNTQTNQTHKKTQAKKQN